MASNAKNKRKILKASPPEEIEKSIFNLRDKYIRDDGKEACFERLCYSGCPLLTIRDDRVMAKKKNAKLLDMNRRLMIIKIYTYINDLPYTDRSKINKFEYILNYIKFLDGKGIAEIFSKNSIEIYTDELLRQYRIGLKGKTLQLKQAAIRDALKYINRDIYSDCKKIFIDFPNDSTPRIPYTDNELNSIIKALKVIYNSYSRNIINNDIPKKFPLYDHEIYPDISNEYIWRYTSTGNRDIWKFDLSRVAYLIVCFYTGANSTSLLKLRFSDIDENTFKSSSRGNYTLHTVKGRQGGQSNYIDVGFSKKAKLFFESWLDISRKLSSGIDGYLFPKLVNGRTSAMSTTESMKLNSIFKAYNITSITNQRLRKTKAAVLIRVTESIIKVSEGLNNSLGSASKSYSDGAEEQMEFSLAMALNVMERTSKGEGIELARANSEFQYRDPLREEYFLKNKGIIPTSVSSGLRCGNPFGEKANSLKKLLVKENLADVNEQVACFKLIDCFECPSHAVIAEVEDVWLLLSFQDVILEIIALPAINSVPSQQLINAHSKLKSILIKIKTDFNDIYELGREKYLDSPHPLWADTDDFGILAGVYS